MASSYQKGDRVWTEEIEIDGSEILEQVRALIKEGNVRRLIIKKSNDEVILEVPLTTGVAVGGVLTVFTPVLVALGAMAALLARVKFVIERVEETQEKK